MAAVVGTAECHADDRYHTSFDFRAEKAGVPLRVEFGKNIPERLFHLSE